jgi:hypothetical protein
MLPDSFRLSPRMRRVPRNRYPKRLEKVGAKVFGSDKPCPRWRVGQHACRRLERSRRRVPTAQLSSLWTLRSVTRETCLARWYDSGCYFNPVTVIQKSRRSCFQLLSRKIELPAMYAASIFKSSSLFEHAVPPQGTCFVPAGRRNVT